METTKPQTQGKAKAGATGKDAGSRPAPGARLAAAFEAVEKFPVLLESRARVMHAATAETGRLGELVETVEADVGLAIAVLRFANRSSVARRQHRLRPGRDRRAQALRRPRHCRHRAGLRLLRDQRRPRDAPRALPRPRPGHPAGRRRDRPCDRLGGPRRTRGCLAPARRRAPGHRQPPSRRSQSLRRPRTRRPSSDCARNATGSASTTLWSAACWPGAGACRSGSPSRSSAITPTTPRAWRPWSRRPTWSPTTARARRSLPSACTPRPSAAVSAPTALRDLLYQLPYARNDVSRVSEPCPLSARELDVLRHLSEGMVYKQIAGEMQLSVSTIRTHLHNVYGKIGAVDRAQAVLTARDRGWI